jgi:hypothetical protein
MNKFIELKPNELKWTVPQVFTLTVAESAHWKWLENDVSFYYSFQASHLGYWESEDTCLMILKDIYAQLNIVSDDQVYS